MAWGRYGYYRKPFGRRSGYRRRYFGKKARYQGGRYRETAPRTKYVVKHKEYMEWRLTYVKELAADGTAVVTTYYRINDLYDCTNSGGANVQPLGYDTLMNALMYRYIVYSGSFDLQVMLSGIATSLPIIFVTYISTGSTACTTVRQAMEQPGAQWRILKYQNTAVGNDSNIVRIRQNWDISKYFQKSDNDFVAYNASPTKSLYLNICYGRIDGANMNAGDYDVGVIGNFRFWSEVGKREAPVATS